MPRCDHCGGNLVGEVVYDEMAGLESKAIRCVQCSRQTYIGEIAQPAYTSFAVLQAKHDKRFPRRTT